MSIRIRKSSTKGSPGQVFVYRTVYHPPGVAQSGEKIPGHQQDIYLGSLPRFTKPELATTALVYTDAKPFVPAKPAEGGKPAQPAKPAMPKPTPLNADELAKLKAFLADDFKNYDPKAYWPKDMVAAIRTAVLAELEQKQPADAGITTKQTIKALAANTTRLVALANELTKANKSPRTALWKSEYVPLENAWADAKKALQAAGIVAKRPRPSKAKGA
jgi:hypothetical protein